MAPKIWNAVRSLGGGIDEIPLPMVQGRLWLTGKHVVGPDPEGALVKVGASTIVCLTEIAELSHRFPGYVEWLATQPSHRAVHFPIGDLSMLPVETMVPFFNDLEQRLRAGDGLIVHCAAGIGRSGTTAVALAVMLGMPLDYALAHVRAHRPMAGPEVGTQRDLVHAIADTTRA